MTALGVHFALADEDVASLRALPDDAARLDFVSGNIEERYFASTETTSPKATRPGTPYIAP